MKACSIKFHGSPSGGSFADTRGQTDGRTWRSYQGPFAAMRTHLKSIYGDCVRATGVPS